MGIYEDLGLKPIINANATLTRLGGSLMPAEVVEAMIAASRTFVDLDALQREVGRRLAQLTHNEGAFVSAGAAAGLTLAAAACLTGTNLQAIEQLPDTTGLKDEIIVHKSHRNGYDHSVRMTGVKMVEIGDAAGATLKDLEEAISSQTAAIFWFEGVMRTEGDLPLETVCATARKHDIPVVVDGAAQLPPVENLWRWTEMGAALAVFSGGKDLRGPQASGLCVGQQDLIEAMILNGNPNHGIGRPMKVGKEEMVGLLKAVELYLQIDQAARARQDEMTVTMWCEVLNQQSGVAAERTFPNEANQPLPRTKVTFQGMDRDGVVAALLAGDPAISVAPAGQSGIYLNPMTLAPGESEIVLARLLEIIHEQRSDSGE